MTRSQEWEEGYAAGVKAEAHRISEQVRLNAIRDRIMDHVRKMNEAELRRLWSFINPPLGEQA